MSKIKSVMMLVLALLLAVQGIGITNAQAEVTKDTQNLTVDYIFDSLGDALAYGVVAEEWVQGAHAETSLCVNILYKNHTDPILNTSNTYTYSKDHPLTAVVSAPAGTSLNGMQFALCKQVGDALEIQTNMVKTVGGNVTSATLTWETKGTDLQKEKLYVRQVEEQNGAYYIVEEGKENKQGLVVSYGPGITTGAPNSNFIGKVSSNLGIGANDALDMFNMGGYAPTIAFGADVEIGYWSNGKWVDLLGDTSKIAAGTYPVSIRYTNNTTTADGWYAEVPNTDTTTRFKGISFVKGSDGSGTFYYQGKDVVILERASQEDRATELLRQALAFSKKLGCMEGGTRSFIGGENEISRATPSPDGNSTVTGPKTDDGMVVSLYEVRGIPGTDYATGKPSDYIKPGSILVAPNEYVVFNIICNSKDGIVDMPAADDLKYYIGGKTDNATWPVSDSGTADRVLFNFVYEENGVYKPFEGTIRPCSKHGGTLLAPLATVSVTAEPPHGGIIAKRVYNGKEIHQRVMAPEARATWVSMNGGYLSLEKASVGYDWSRGQWVDMSETTPLDGAVFGVYSNKDCTKGSLVTKMTTDTRGKAISDMLPAGTYWIKEITPLKDHELSDTVVEVKVEAGKTVKVQGGGYWVQNGYWEWQGYWAVAQDKFVNQQNEGSASVRVRKVDEFNNTLQGVKFGIYTDEACSQENQVGTMVTNRNGVAVYDDLPLRFTYGAGGAKTPVPYYVKEISAPDGYVMSSNVVKFELTVNDRDKVITIDGNGNASGDAFVNNLERGNLALKKVDEQNQFVVLPGAEFTIYKKEACTDADKVATITTKEQNWYWYNAAIATSENVIMNEASGRRVWFLAPIM